MKRYRMTVDVDYGDITTIYPGPEKLAAIAHTCDREIDEVRTCLKKHIEVDEDRIEFVELAERLQAELTEALSAGELEKAVWFAYQLGQCRRIRPQGRVRSTGGRKIIKNGKPLQQHERNMRIKQEVLDLETNHNKLNKEAVVIVAKKYGLSHHAIQKIDRYSDLVWDELDPDEKKWYRMLGDAVKCLSWRDLNELASKCNITKMKLQSFVDRKRLCSPKIRSQIDAVLAEFSRRAAN